MLAEVTEVITRRRFLALLPPALGALFLAACGDDNDGEAPASSTSTAGPTSIPEATTGPETTSSDGTSTAQLAATPACGDDDEPTIEQTEGPYFTPNSPERTSLLEDGITGDLLRVSGFVVNTSCQPIENALVDFWHCDADGEYDNVGYQLRGHQFTDSSGAYQLETILPGVYTGRTRHIHVKVQAPNQPVLTTQLYFPDEPENTSDGIFDRSLLMEMGQDGETTVGSFQFVIDV
jgi:protocatechuate 3,4-dioxygenase beta subunit